MMNFAWAYGLLGLRSGWSSRANFLKSKQKVPVSLFDLVVSRIRSNSKNFMRIKSDHLSWVSTDEIHEPDWKYNTDGKDSNHNPEISGDILLFKSGCLVFELLVEESSCLKLLIILDAGDTCCFDSLEDQVTEEEDCDEGDCEDEGKEGNVIVLEIFLCLFFLKKRHSLNFKLSI